RRHTRFSRDWSSDVCSSDLAERDVAVAIAQGWDFGATTVSASVALAATAGVRVFATGGIGGVHRGVELTGDVSADLDAIAHHPRSEERRVGKECRAGRCSRT